MTPNQDDLRNAMNDLARTAAPLEPDAVLLAGRLVGHRAGDGGAAGEVRVRADERDARRAGRALDRPHHRRVQRVDVVERPGLVRALGDPRRRLEHAAEARDERLPVHARGG